LGGLQKERWLYLALIALVSASVVIGFAQTYLTRERLLQAADPLPTAVHVHGILFLAWYGIVLMQAVLVLRGSMRLHRWIGTATLALAVAMVASGVLVVAVRMDGGLTEGDQFWSAFSLIILSNLVLFAVFFGAAWHFRRRPDLHRRYMLLAAATGSGAAQFRSLAAVFGQGFYAVPSGILVTNLFVVLAMVGERAIRGQVSRAYWIALPVIIVFECAMLGLAFTPVGVGLQQAIVGLVRPLFALY
jgi:hypothetical protein